MSRPGILIIGPTPPPFHGVSTATKNLLDSPLLNDRFKLIHLETKDGRDLANLGRFDFINVFLAFKQGAEFIWKLWRYRPEIVHLCVSQGSLGFTRDCLFLIPARVLRRRVVVHLHGSDFRDFYLSSPPLFKRLIRYALGRSAAVVVLGRNLTSLFEGIVGSDKIWVVPNGIPDYAAEFKKADRRPGPLKVLWLGSLREDKGIFDLIKAVPLVVKKHPEIRFVFVGGWSGESDQSSARNLIDRLGVGRWLEFRPPAGPPHKYEYFREADIFVLPSHREGQPIAVLEALCAGLPVVATDVGCVAETVGSPEGPGESGFVVEPGNPSALAEKLSLLAADDQLRLRLGEAARDRFLNNYTSGLWAESMSRVFLEASRGRHETRLEPPLTVTEE